jgi:hypothetical protein
LRLLQCDRDNVRPAGLKIMPHVIGRLLDRRGDQEKIAATESSEER